MVRPNIERITENYQDEEGYWERSISWSGTYPPESFRDMGRLLSWIRHLEEQVARKEEKYLNPDDLPFLTYQDLRIPNLPSEKEFEEEYLRDMFGVQHTFAEMSSGELWRWYYYSEFHEVAMDKFERLLAFRRMVCDEINRRNGQCPDA